jgi:MerR family transcriptional regulator, light-induced transcriptional regulator
MSSDLQWNPATHYQHGLEQLRSFTEPMAPAVARPTESHLQDFAAVIENVIVPRLLMGHANTRAVKARTEQLAHATRVDDFIALTMSDHPQAAIDFVQGLLDDGIEFKDILLHLMAPAARELGARWTQDETSFVEVTLGVARMHRILREFDGVPDHMWSNRGEGLHALLLPTPGELHTFGLRLVHEFLLRESWTVTNHPVEVPKQLESIIRHSHFDFVGLSLSGETLIDNLVSSIRIIKAKSKNPHIKVIVGGQIFFDRPELVAMCGADAHGVDAPATVTMVNGWATRMLVTA